MDLTQDPQMWILDPLLGFLPWIQKWRCVDPGGSRWIRLDPVDFCGFSWIFLSTVKKLEPDFELFGTLENAFPLVVVVLFSFYRCSHDLLLFQISAQNVVE